MLALLLACASPDPVAGDDATIRLVWYRTWPDETWEQARAGLWWELANLGALPDGTEITELEGQGDRREFTLSLAGFSLAGLTDVLAELRDSDEVRQTGAMDVGRFLMKTLYAPWRYYAATRACPTLTDWRNTHLAATPETYAVTVSWLVDGERKIRFNAPDDTLAGMGLEVAESAGTFEDGTFDSGVTEVETIDVMPNGQQRFAAYDAAGELIPYATASPAGQPGKCMWCHEGTFHPGNPDNPGTDFGTADDPWLSRDAFAAEIDRLSHDLDSGRAQLPTVVDWDEYDVHEWGEHLSEGFLQPTPARLALEWDVSEGEVAERAAGIATHADEEAPELGTVYWRSDVDDLLASDTFAPVRVPDSSREPSEVEGDGTDLAPCAR